MGNKKKKSRGYTEERKEVEVRESKKEKESNKSGSLKLFLLVGLCCVVIPVVAVVYSNEDYQRHIGDVLRKGKVLWDSSVNKLDIERKDVVTDDNENSIKENFVSSQNELYKESDQDGGSRDVPSRQSKTNQYEDSRDTSSRQSETHEPSGDTQSRYSQTHGSSHTEENINNEPPSQNAKISKTEQNQIHDSKHLENKSKLGSDLKSECESKHGTSSKLCSDAVETATVEQESSSNTETSNTEKENNSELKSTTKDARYEKISITNQRDYKFREELDEADIFLNKDNVEEALRGYDKVIMKYPKSPRAIYGKAETLDKMAENQRSNSLLEEAIATFQKVLDIEDVPQDLVIKAGTRLAERQQFRGWGGKAVRTLNDLCTRFPDNVDLKRKLGVGNLIIGQIEKSKQVFREILTLNPDDGFAKVHLGFIIKTSDNDPKSAIPFLKEGIDSNEEGTQDGRFYFHLGDAYQRLQQSDEAYRLYEAGAQKGLFLSAYQRSLYNVDHLTGRPWWKPDQTGYKTYLKMLEDNWRVIKEEGMAQLDMKSGSFLPEEENLREKGDWKQFTLYQQGRKIKENCAKVPKTCELIDKIPDAKGCTRGQVKFSVMHPGVHVWPHCGPTNCRIRAHLGLVVPKGPRIRVANTTRQWSVGKFIIFDDSFEHEVWHNGTDLRLVLIVDFWHPELSALEKRDLTPI